MADRISDKKTRVNFSVTKECDALIQAIADGRGISRNAAMEIIVRYYADAHAITVTPVTPESETK